MIVFFIVGMPASGKSTIGKALAEALSKAFVDQEVQFVEMSDIVRAWRGTRDINSTEIASQELYSLMWHNFYADYADIVVCSGVREPFLVEPPRSQAKLKTFIVEIRVDRELRRTWYRAREFSFHKNESDRVSFDTAEARALDLGMAGLCMKADMVIPIAAPMLSSSVDSTLGTFAGEHGAPIGYVMNCVSQIIGAYVIRSVS